MTKGLISKNTTGFLLISGLTGILSVNILLSQSFILGITLAIILFISVLFLYNPYLGLFLIISLRVSTDRIGNNYSIGAGKNLNLNTNALTGILLVGLILSYVIFKKWKIKKTIIPVIIAWIFYLTTASISIFFSIERNISFYELFRLFSIFIIFIFGYLITHKKNPDKIFKIIIGASVVPLVFSFYQTITETGMGRVAGLKNRLYGTFSDPNSFAAFVLIIISILVYFIIKKSEKFDFSKNWKEFSLLVSLILIMLATFSRGGWLALIIFGSILSIFKKPKLLLVLISILILTTLTIEPIRNRLEDVYNPPITSSIYWRFEQWDKMSRLFARKPLTGYGLGTETIVHEKEFGFYSGNPYTHNDVLKNALETGVFGLISYIALMLTTFLSLIKNYSKTRNKNLRNIILIIFILFLAELGFSMTSNILRSTVIQWILWLMIGSGLGVLADSKE